MAQSIVRLTKRLAPEPDEVFPAWQGMQYMRDMLTGHAKLSYLANDRYPEVPWTQLTARLRTVIESPSQRAVPDR